MVDFLWRTLSIPAMKMKKITQLKWESNSLTFEELIFFSAETLILRKNFNHYGGGFKDVLNVDTETNREDEPNLTRILFETYWL